jgi:hypothetical protein
MSVLSLREEIHMLKKQCVTCKKIQDVSFHRELRSSADGFRDNCKKCEKEYSVAQRFSKYGITKADYDFMFLEQRGNCKICSCSLSYDKKSTHVDHCHKTGKVRGLLCLHCNIMIGMAKENQETLKAAIQYLEDNKNDL